MEKVNEKITSTDSDDSTTVSESELEQHNGAHENEKVSFFEDLSETEQGDFVLEGARNYDQQKTEETLVKDEVPSKNKDDIIIRVVDCTGSKDECMDIGPIPASVLSSKEYHKDSFKYSSDGKWPRDLCDSNPDGQKKFSHTKPKSGYHDYRRDFKNNHRGSPKNRNRENNYHFKKQMDKLETNYNSLSLENSQQTGPVAEKKKVVIKITDVNPKNRTQPQSMETSPVQKPKPVQQREQPEYGGTRGNQPRYRPHTGTDRDHYQPTRDKVYYPRPRAQYNYGAPTRPRVESDVQAPMVYNNYGYPQGPSAYPPPQMYPQPPQGMQGYICPSQYGDYTYCVPGGYYMPQDYTRMPYQGDAYQQQSYMQYNPYANDPYGTGYMNQYNYHNSGGGS